MSKMLLSIKIDKHLGHQAKKIAHAAGLPLSTVVSGQLRKFVAERRIEFSVPIKMSKKLEKELAAVEKDRKTGRNFSPAFTNAEEMDRWLGI